MPARASGIAVPTARLLTIADVATELGLSTTTIKRRIARGDLPAFRDGTRIVRIRRTDLDGYIANHVEHSSRPAVARPGRALRPGERLWD